MISVAGFTTGINGRRGTLRARNPPSLVGFRQTPTSKTLRNRGFFWDSREPVASSLCSSHLNGDGGEYQFGFPPAEFLHKTGSDV